MRDVDRLGAAVAAVYDSVLDQTGWSSALGAVAGAFEAPAATLWRYDPALGTMAEAHAFGHDRAALQAYAERHVHDDPATPVVLAAGVARWLSDEVLLDPRQPSHRRYVHEFALPNGIGRPDETVTSTAVLRDLFGVTMTEAVLLKALAAGESVQAHAARRRVSVHTVRSHIAALLDKLGCRSQHELAALARARCRRGGSRKRGAGPGRCPAVREPQQATEGADCARPSVLTDLSRRRLPSNMTER
jgi:DNA-binding CsgD family transcriptional regulator